MLVIAPMKPVNVAVLKAQLIAAGVPGGPWSIPEPDYSGDGKMAVTVPDGTDLQILAEVLESHLDGRTFNEILKAKAKKLANDEKDSERTIRIAIVRVFSKRDKQVRAWLNSLVPKLAAKGVTMPAIQEFTLAETAAEIVAEIDAVLV